MVVEIDPTMGKVAREKWVNSPFIITSSRARESFPSHRRVSGKRV